MKRYVSRVNAAPHAADLRDHAGRLPSGDRALVGKILEGSKLQASQ